MNGCTETGKPPVSVLMAVYEPRMDWLREQLCSLNAQTYPNLRLYVRDDCSPTVPYEEICNCVRECISAFPVSICRNEKNLGSNGTFAQLTLEAEGEYFAYCDQDDVWLPEKLEKLTACLEESGADLVCSDVLLIDGEGKQFADSITQVRPRHVFCEESHPAPQLIYRNYVIGCTMLVRSTVAKAALPFAKHMVHDHYLAFYCACGGGICVCPDHLVRYRIHGGNQTGVLAKVTDRESYRQRHMLPFCDRVEELQSRFSLPELEEAAQWAKARKRNAERAPGGARALWKLRRLNLPTTVFELVALRCPQFLFVRMLDVIRSGKI